MVSQADKDRTRVGMEVEEKVFKARMPRSQQRKGIAMETPKLREKRLRKLHEYKARYSVAMNPDKRAKMIAPNGAVAVITKRPRGRPRKHPRPTQCTT